MVRMSKLKGMIRWGNTIFSFKGDQRKRNKNVEFIFHSFHRQNGRRVWDPAIFSAG